MGGEAATPTALPQQDSASTSPARVAALLHEAHVRRDYGRIASWIADSRRQATIDFLRAVDAVLDSHADLRSVARRRFGEATSDPWRLDAMANNLGLFSEDVRLLNQVFTGTTASVTLQEGDHVPLVRAVFEKTDQSWRYRPQATPVAVTPELRRLASILTEITASLEAGATFDQYMDAFQDRVLPQIRRVMAQAANSTVQVADADIAY